MRALFQSAKENKGMTYFIFSLVLVAVYCVFNYFAAKPNPEKGWKGWLTIVVPALVLGGAYHGVNYFCLPTMSYDTLTIYLELIAFAGLTLWFTSFRTDKHELCYQFEDAMRVKTWKYGLLTVLGGITLLVVSGIYTWDFFHTSYQQQLLKVEVAKDAEVKKMVSPIPVEKMCTVSPKVAERVILTKMGDLKNTYELGKMTKQSFTGKFEATTSEGQKVLIDYTDQLVYVAPLEHKGFWTWAKQKYTPAYVLVDASDEDKAYVITEVNGEPIKLAYTTGANFEYNLERHLRSNGYVSTLLDDFNMEIDENGRPFSPVTTLENSVGISTPVVTGVAVVDMQTGDIKWYTPESAPKFVNCIQPESLIYDRLYTWGDYKNGYFHWSDKNGLLQACEGMDIVQTPNGCFYYVGVQAQTDAVGTQGYLLIDVRTGEAKYFKRNGISEQEAIKVLEANTDLNVEMNQGVLSLTEPIFYNIEGLKTYFSTYVSTKDLTVKYYGFCSTDNKAVWGYGTTLEEAKASYMASYYKENASKSAKFQTADKQSIITLEAVVLEKVQEGNAYYFRLSGQDGKTFYAYSSITPEVRWEAKKIKITYNKTDAKMIAISSYEALN